MNTNTAFSSPPRRLALWIALFLLASGAIFGFGYGLGVSNSGGSGTTFSDAIKKTVGVTSTVSFNQLPEVWDFIKKNHISESPDQTKAVYGALQGMVESLEDPYTVFLTPEDTESFRDEIGGIFEGIGAEIGMKDEQLVIIAPLPESPAERAGLLAGDRVESIDGTPTLGMTLDEAVGRIRGNKGTTVTLVIRKPGVDTPQEVQIVRESITVKSVRLTMQDGGIGTIKLSYFGAQTEQEMRDAANQFLLKGGKGLILDMRSNPGGFLNTAVSLSSFFMEKDKVVVIERFKDGSQTEYKSADGGELKGIPLIVLVDQGSASAAEIMAGALQDHRLATLVGTKTFGKGSVQQLEEFKDGSSLKLTVAKWLTPQERSINEQGITPDVEVGMTKEDYDANRDPQMDKALLLIREALAQ